LQGQTPETRRRREGDTLYVQCSYAAVTKDWDTKFWCYVTDQGVEELVRTYYQQRGQSKDGRITIEGNTTSKTVSITMSDLKAEDSGTYFCAYYASRYISLRTISLNVFKAHIPAVFQGPSSTQPRSQATSSGNTFLILSVVLLILLLLALTSSMILGVRHCKLLGRAGNREAEDTSDRAEGTAEPGSTGRRESPQDDSKGPGYINLDMQSQPSPEDPLYCNVEPSQALRNPQNVEYAVIAFSQSPRNGRE
ncbi:TRML4 protein, partial [Daphoenositta chrysoptera]|nr:TRML4 protein [Daphoenositta chrysoptera]